MDQSEEETIFEEPHSAIDPTATEAESVTDGSSMNIDTEPIANNNNNNVTRASAFSSLLSRISGLVSRMAEYRPSVNTPANNNTNDEANNQEETVDVDSREEPQATNNNTNTDEAEHNAVLNINVEINETNEPPVNDNNTSMPPLETTVTNVNVNEDEFRSLSTAIASSSVSIDIPAARGELNNNDEPSTDENSEVSRTRFNLLGINNSITQGTY